MSKVQLLIAMPCKKASEALGTTNMILFNKKALYYENIFIEMFNKILRINYIYH